MNISFTGHREFVPELLDEPLIETIIRECETTSEQIKFLSGMAVGFDMAAAEAVIEAKRRGHNVRLWCVIPYTDQPQFFASIDKERYNAILEAADKVTTLQSDYSPDVFHRRNDFLIDQCDKLIAYWDGQRGGGTYYTFRRARKRLIPSENLYPQQQLTLKFQKIFSEQSSL